VKLDGNKFRFLDCHLILSKFSGGHVQILANNLNHLQEKKSKEKLFLKFAQKQQNSLFLVVYIDTQTLQNGQIK
jgi:hypothetical protein